MSFRTEGWSDVQLHVVQDFAIRAAKVIALLLPGNLFCQLLVSVVLAPYHSASARDTKELQIARLRT